jgi:hypothetical protein
VYKEWGCAWNLIRFNAGVKLDGKTTADFNNTKTPGMK